MPTIPANSASPSRVVLSGDNTTACIVSGLDSMPFNDVARLFARYGSANALRQRRLDRRDDAIRQLVMHYDATGGRPLADAIRRDLLRYAASGYRVNPAPPADAKRALLHQILDLIGSGKVPGATQMRTILAGVRSSGR